MHRDAHGVSIHFMGRNDVEVIKTKNRNAVQLAPSGRLDITTGPILTRIFDQALGEGERFFVLDCEHLEYISSAGLREILKMEKKLQSLNGRLVLCNLHGVVRDIFQFSGFLNLFAVSDTVEAALDVIQ